MFSQNKMSVTPHYNILTVTVPRLERILCVVGTELLMSI